MPERRDYAQVHARRRLAERKARAILGARCIRCGITQALHWDHVNDDGHASKTVSGRRRKPGLSALYGEFNKIIATGRSDKIQLLCANCNHLKQFDPEEYDRPPAYGMRGTHHDG